MSKIQKESKSQLVPGCPFAVTDVVTNVKDTKRKQITTYCLSNDISALDVVTNVKDTKRKQITTVAVTDKYRDKML